MSTSQDKDNLIPFSQINKIHALLVQAGVSTEALQNLLETGLLSDLFGVTGKGCLDEVDRVGFCGTLGFGFTKLPICVDYELSLAEMIGEGSFGSVDPRITSENFPINGSGRQEFSMSLVHLNRRVSSTDIRSSLFWRVKQSATIEQLIAFGIAYPEIQRRFSIVVFTSEVFPLIPCLSTAGDLYLRENFPKQVRVLVVS